MLLLSLTAISSLAVGTELETRASGDDASIGEWIDAIRAVGHRGAGHEAAQKALQHLHQCGPDALVPILKGIRGANPLAANWLLNAFEVIADREVRGGRGLPADELERFLLDRNNAPRARRVAFEWLAKVDPSVVDRLIPGMLRDPSPEFRRDAVARLMADADRLRGQNHLSRAVALYRKALTGATDQKQVEALVKRLKELGQKVNLQRHFGFIVDWQIIGPFDNTDRKGFAAVYPPEREVNLQSSYPGKLGPVRWKPIHTDAPYGIVNIAKSVAPYKGAVMYLTAEFFSRESRPVEFRLGTPNAVKVWLNGKLLFAREEYHRGMFLDQFRVPAELQAGRNRILIKLCQNEQTEPWAQRYEFQFRVCDPSGLAVLSAGHDSAASRP